MNQLEKRPCLGLETPCPVPAGEVCERCAALAPAVAVARTPDVALPPALRARLLAIPVQVKEQASPAAVDDEVETPTLYLEALAAARGAAFDVQALLPESRATYLALRDFFRTELEEKPAPLTLIDRLRALPWRTSRSVPIWLRDGRFAVAAGLLLTALSFASFNEVLARVPEERLERVQNREWLIRVEERVDECKRTVGADALTFFAETRARGSHKAERAVERVNDHVRNRFEALKNSKLGRLIATELSQLGASHEPDPEQP